MNPPESLFKRRDADIRVFDADLHCTAGNSVVRINAGAAELAVAAAIGTLSCVPCL